MDKNLANKIYNISVYCYISTASDIKRYYSENLKNNIN